jgi:hypothetical protein
MADALTAARDMGLPAAAIARLARLASVSMDDAEVLAARLVADLRDAGWIAERREFPLPPLTVPSASPVDTRIASAFIVVAESILDLANGVTLASDLRRKLKRLTDGVIE